MTMFKLTVAALLAASATTAVLAEPVETMTPAYMAGTDPSVAFPDVGSSWAREGRFVSSRNIRMIAPGRTRPQIYALVGEPMFGELFPFQTSWNYIFNFYTGNGDAFVQCQYQIQWESPMVVKSAYWKDGSCAKFVADAPPPAPPPPPLPPARSDAPVAVMESKSFLVYFPFDSAEITAEAAAVVRSAADYEHSGRGAHTVVVGYTDASGSVDYNLALSERRAKAVADALAADGDDAASLDVSWKGKSDLATPTPDGVKEPLNRRATISVVPAR